MGSPFFRSKLEHKFVLVEGGRKMNKEPTTEARLRHQLDVQSQQINRVMSHHRIPATVSGGDVQSRILSFNLQTQIAAGIERIRGLKEDLVSALGVGDVALTRDGNQWRLRVTRPDDPPVPLLQLLGTLDLIPSLTAVIGMADGGQPVLLNFSANNTSHVLLAGESGAGKTTLLRTIAVALALANKQSDLQLQVMDPDGSGEVHVSPSTHPLMPLGYLPHMLTDPALGMEACAEIIHFLAEEMNYRRQQQVISPRIVTIIDNVQSYLEQSDPVGRNDLLRLLQYGAKAGIHVVMATDRPESPLLDSTIKASISMKIIGHLNDPLTAKRIAGIRLDQASLLYGEGDFLAVAGSEVTYFQAAHIGNFDLHMMLGQLLDQNRPRLLAQPYQTRPTIVKGKQSPAKSFSVREGSIDLHSEEP